MAAEPQQPTCATYEPEQQVRLFTLTRDEAQEIKFEVQTLNLEDCAGTYSALSYCWDDRRTTAKVNGEDLEIPQNLLDFLESCYQHHSDAMNWLFWCDAICMDCIDNTEKAFDAKYVTLIYEQASDVIVWLGPETDQTPLAQSFVHKILGHHDARTEELGSELEALRQIQPRHPGLLDFTIQGAVVNSDISDALFKFLSHSWWTRTWTMQEIVNGEMIFMWGKELLFFWDMFIVASYAREIFEEMNFQWTRSGHSLLYEELPMRRMLSNIFTRYVFPRHLAKAMRYNLPTSALLLLQNFRMSAAEDPRDKVYAALSLLDKDQSDVFSIDYIVPIEKVFKDTACQLIFSTEPPNLDVLGLCGADPDEPSNLLPSWTPDFSIWSRQTAFHKRLNPGNEPVYHADKALRKLVTSEGYIRCLGDRLFLKGILVDTVSALSSKSTILRQFSMTYDWLPDNHRDGIYFTNETMDLVYRRTLAADIEDDDVEEQTVQRGAEIDWAVLTDALQGHQYWDMTRIMAEAWHERRLLISEKGFFGLGPNGLQVGDQLYILLGGQMIYALRKSSDDYRCIGECYIHGWMDGHFSATKDQVEDITLI